MLRIVADANIPAADRAFGALGEVRMLSGREITPATVRDADVLLVRSVTPVDGALLDGSAVRFVGSATAGTDHVDRTALAERGVAFAHAPGSNAESVVEWVLAALLATAADRGEPLAGKALGVVGVGAVGGRLVPRAEALGMRVLVSDPPREAAGTLPNALPLADLLRQSDVVTLHTPLTAPAESAWPTLGLLDAAALARLPAGAWVVNASRGPVVDGDALGDALDAGTVGEALLDVWPGEPAPSPRLAARARVATPHVAGYSLDGKLAGTRRIADALRQWLADRGEAPAPWDVEDALPTGALTVTAPPAGGGSRAAWLDALARQAYDVRADTARFRAAIPWDGSAEERASAFARLRKTYPARRAWSRFAVRGDVPRELAAAVGDGLAMRASA